MRQTVVAVSLGLALACCARGRSRIGHTARAVRPSREALVLGSCEDTNLNLFLPSAEARAWIPSAVGAPLGTPRFGGNTTPLNVAHFRCTEVSVGGRPVTSVNFALIRVPLDPGGHFVLWVLTDSRELHDALSHHGIDSHLVTDVSLRIAGTTWTKTWGGDFAPYSVVAHQVIVLPREAGPVDWVFRGSRGVVHIAGTSTLSEEFGDRGPAVSVPARSALRPFVERSLGVTALTHRNSFDLTPLLPRSLHAARLAAVSSLGIRRPGDTREESTTSLLCPTRGRVAPQRRGRGQRPHPPPNESVEADVASKSAFQNRGE